MPEMPAARREGARVDPQPPLRFDELGLGPFSAKRRLWTTHRVAAKKTQNPPLDQSRRLKTPKNGICRHNAG